MVGTVSLLCASHQQGLDLRFRHFAIPCGATESEQASVGFSRFPSNGLLFSKGLFHPTPEAQEADLGALVAWAYRKGTWGGGRFNPLPVSSLISHIKDCPSSAFGPALYDALDLLEAILR